MRKNLQRATSVEPAAPSFLPVPVRPRADGWTGDKQIEFIETLADTGNVRAAAAAVGMTEQSAHRLRRRADADSFDAAWEAALETGLGRLVAIGLERAVEGSFKRTYYHGELVDEQVVHSEKLLIWLLENGRAALGRTKERRKVADDWEGAMVAIGQCADSESRFRFWLDEFGHWVTNYPPPADFGELFEQGRPGQRDYYRVLTPEEEAAHEARIGCCGDDGSGERDAWFGFAGG
ncbi:MAG: hypothetical protein H7X93_03255 [Sphingomonadaceae bacterium]|nr:hypothetical protein [Sphingomonadaceae bacterium]